MNYPEAIEFLHGLSQFGTHPGLENPARLAEMHGNPQRGLRFIHVAGTNGKGSTCAMLESIYRHAGYRTGLFTSPHLVSFTERIQINRANIPEAEVARWTALIVEALGGRDPARWPFRPTFFEFATMMGLLFFARERCDVVLWETGLGGRLDATNIVEPLACVITNIQFDHQQWLGHTLAEISAEKAGIIKPRIPVITGVDDPSALEVIRAKALETQAPLTVAYDLPKSVDLSLLGEHQRRNAALALETVRQFQSTLPVAREAVDAGLANTAWPGRLQLIALPRGRVLLDGAHNPAGAASLAEALRRYFSTEEITLVLGLFRDKSWELMCDALVPQCHRVYLTPVESERAADPAAIKEYCDAHFPAIETLVSPSLRGGIDQALGRGLVVVTGSLYFIGEAMEILGITPRSSSERALNEWDAARGGTG
jgi:dihydrofolate synthase/folylpolyglutamate synthase